MPCSRQPLSTTTALSFSGVSTRLMGKLPRSTASPTGSSRTPVGSGEVKTGLVWADSEVHSSAESARASRRIRSENITGVSHTFDTETIYRGSFGVYQAGAYVSHQIGTLRDARLTPKRGFRRGWPGKR